MSLAIYLYLRAGVLACRGWLFFSNYPTALKGCRGLVFTHGVRLGLRAGGWAAGKSLSRLYLQRCFQTARLRESRNFLKISRNFETTAWYIRGLLYANVGTQCVKRIALSLHDLNIHSIFTVLLLYDSTHA